MMQIHIDAIQKSRVAETQYVLSKSLDTVCVSDENKLLEYLKNGWDIVGKYHNGVGEDNYKTSSVAEIASIKYYIEKELLGHEVEPATTITISFREYYAPITCESEDLKANITFFNMVDGKLKHECFYIEDENAKKVRDIISALFMKQDKATVIDLLEKKISRKV